MGVLTAAVLALAPPARASNASIYVHEDEMKSPAVAADPQQRMHLAYAATRPDNTAVEVFYASSGDGQHWSAGTKVSTGAPLCFNPAIAAGAHGEVLIAWAEAVDGGTNAVRVAVSVDSGRTWAKPVTVGQTSTQSDGPAVAISPEGDLHVAFSYVGLERASDVWHSRSADHGKTWTQPVNISRTPGESASTGIACGPGGEVAVAWGDTPAGTRSDSDIWLAISRDGGRTWRAPQNVSNTPGLSANPSVAIDENGDIFLAWDDEGQRGAASDIFFLISRNQGQTFEQFRNVSRTPGISSNAEIAVDRGRIAIAWIDVAPGAPSPDLFISTSTDDGRTFSEPRKLPNAPVLGGSPDVVITGATATVVWEEVERFVSHVRAFPVPIP